MIEHIFSYLVELFRKYDIEKNGQIDINGTPRAKTESMLGTIQYFIICFFCGIVVVKVSTIDRSKVPLAQVFAVMWIIVDSLCMLFFRVYSSFVM